MTRYVVKIHIECDAPPNFERNLELEFHERIRRELPHNIKPIIDDDNTFVVAQTHQEYNDHSRDI